MRDLRRRVRAAVPWLPKCCAVAGLLVLTNEDPVARTVLFLHEGQTTKVAMFAIVWTACAVALFAAALHPSVRVRIFWAVPIALGTAVSAGYHRVAGSELGPLDAVALWHSRSDAYRAAEFYGWVAPEMALVFVAAFAVVAAPVPAASRAVRRMSRPLAFVPVLPVVGLVAVLVALNGRGAVGAPRQFAQASIGIYAALKIGSDVMPARNHVAIAAGPELQRAVVLLVDESIRADYAAPFLDLGGTASAVARGVVSVDFGPAVSGANCSHYSNAILRFAANRGDLVRSMQTSPTIWDYAKAAGYRTVYVDAQSDELKAVGGGGVVGRYQNFMTQVEASKIDEYVVVAGDGPTWENDLRLADAVALEVSKPGKVFVYANKNGAHFPYGHAYPPSRDTVVPAAGETPDRAMRSDYARAVAWSVDGFFRYFLGKADLEDALVLYTSDHGQRLESGRSTHCNAEGADPREGLVPLVALTKDRDLGSRLEAGAEANRLHASHFAIVPTLLETMGYAEADIDGTWGESLFRTVRRGAAFTSGDILGVVADDVRWNEVDLSKDWMEREGDDVLVADHTKD